MTPAPRRMVVVLIGALLSWMTTEFINLAQVNGEHAGRANVELMKMHAKYPQVNIRARKRGPQRKTRVATFNKPLQGMAPTGCTDHKLQLTLITTFCMLSSPPSACPDHHLQNALIATFSTL